MIANSNIDMCNKSSYFSLSGLMKIGLMVQFCCAGTGVSMTAGLIGKKVGVLQDLEEEVLNYCATLKIFVRNASPIKCSKVKFGIGLIVWIAVYY